MGLRGDVWLAPELWEGAGATEDLASEGTVQAPQRQSEDNFFPGWLAAITPLLGVQASSLRGASLLSLCCQELSLGPG